MTFEAEVRDLASDGRGIVATPEGLTCFVAGVWVGERGSFKLLPGKSKVQEAQLVELLEPSPARRSAPCKFHGHDKNHCGGCAWQFVNYDAQLEAKQQRVQNVLQRLQSEINILPVQAAPNEFFYRNRAQLKTDGRRLGFEGANTNLLIAIDDCLVLSDKNRETLQALLARLPEKQWQTLPEKRSRHKRHKKIRWVSLDINESTSAEQVSVNQRLPFEQGNSAQNRFMKNWLEQQLVSLSAEQNVLELFCGSGNFTEVIAAKGFTEVICSELDSRALAELKQRKLVNVKTVECNLFDEEQLDALLIKAVKAQTLVLDPPRDGFKNISRLCDRLRRLNKVLYISCDVATFARDAKTLLDKGFVIEHVQPVDLFPQTPHLELLATFSLK